MSTSKEAPFYISVQTLDFQQSEEYEQLRLAAPKIGAIATFTGLVRELNHNEHADLFLEHYPGMTERSLKKIIQEAQTRWPISHVRLIHRIGHLTPGEQIVFVGVSSAHRKAAFSACEFIMDFLKTEAPFWKKEITEEKEYWVEAKESDALAKKRWGNK